MDLLAMASGIEHFKGTTLEGPASERLPTNSLCELLRLNHGSGSAVKSA